MPNTSVTLSHRGNRPAAIAAIAAVRPAPIAVRLQVLDKGNALDAIKAFSAGQADLAVARAHSFNVLLAFAIMVAVITWWNQR